MSENMNLDPNLELDWGADTTFYVKGDGPFASVKFRDPEGVWCQIFYRRYESPYYGIEVHCLRDCSAPEPGEYQALLPESG